VGELPRRKHKIQTPGNYPEENIKFRRRGITQKKTYKIQTSGNYPEENT